MITVPQAPMVVTTMRILGPRTYGPLTHATDHRLFQFESGHEVRPWIRFHLDRARSLPVQTRCQRAFRSVSFRQNERDEKSLGQARG